MDNDARFPKRLIEVDLPIRSISAHAAEEKDSRKGHIPQLHIYPAARPAAACRAVLCASLWPDPADSTCPDGFRRAAREALLRFAMAVTKQPKAYTKFPRFHWSRWSGGQAVDNSDWLDLRRALCDFLSDFSAWDAAIDPNFLVAARAISMSAHAELSGTPNRFVSTVVFDPFCGGGVIPLEALRVGSNAIASDINPVAILITKLVTQSVPRANNQISTRARAWTFEVQERVREKAQTLYPTPFAHQVPVAYVWARTVLSEAPSEDQVPVEIPMLRSMWLHRKPKNRSALRWIRTADGSVATKKVTARYADGSEKIVLQPQLEIFVPQSPKDVETGTAKRNAAVCPVTGYTTPARRVEHQLKARFGGASDARLVCVVEDTPSGRQFRTPIPQDIVSTAVLENYLAQLADKGLVVPDEPLHVMSGVLNAPIYGHNTWGSLFSTRQNAVLLTYCEAIREVVNRELCADKEKGVECAAILGVLLDRLADLNASLCVWQLSTKNNAHVFGRWALPMITDFAEVNPLAGAGGSPESALRRLDRIVNYLSAGDYEAGEVFQRSAGSRWLPDDSVDLLFTDPPYYNAIPYADLMDFFYVWLRRSVGEAFPELLSSATTPKDEELCELAGWDPDRYGEKDKTFFENGMTKAFGCARKAVKPDGLGVVVFAHKSTGGWEAMVNALIRAGWIVTASWPIDTEMASRLRARNSAVLASSIHLVCRPRENPDGSLLDDVVGDWRAVLSELPQRIHDWMPRLAEEGVVGADAIFACLGPALEIYSRYSRVEKVSGERVELREYLEQVWAAVAREALSMIFEDADATGLEEDARLTSMWLWTLSTSNGRGATSKSEDRSDEKNTDQSKFNAALSLEFDAARKIAQGLGAHLEDLSRVVEIKGDRARLLSVAERTRHLFGKDQVHAPHARRTNKVKQLTLFEELEAVEKDADWGDIGLPPLGVTTLDRIHQSMVLFAAGRGEALKRFLVEEGVGRVTTFWKLAQSLSALYPSGTDEKRWVDGVLSRKKALGF